ncbi:MAG: flap endonuclease-1 [Methanosarcinaceae archaeon]|nr:flap endonuclease-1 [Methanosarcinaceae archaeon]MDD4331577.1 flap endonuclease-1 [Methanosarcinaceae archaeon]
MGTAIGELLQKKNIGFSELTNQIVAIDAFNTLHQFLSIIRQRDGSPLQDSKGRITSHLSGLLYRTTSLVEAGIRPVFVFDGKPPELKAETLNKRKEVRESAQERWENAKEEGDLKAAYKHAQASSKVDAQIVEEAKYLLSTMGIPSVQAPSEGEAQAAYMVLKKDADFVASQDYDAFLFGAPAVIRNLAVTGKRKLPGKNSYVEVEPELIELEASLKKLEINREQLIDLALCVGTDFNKGLERVGPKTALKLIKKHGDIYGILREKEAEIEGLEEIRTLFFRPPATKEYELKWKKPDREKMLAFLCEEHDFSRARVEKAYERLKEASGARQQTLDQWF